MSKGMGGFPMKKSDYPQKLYELSSIDDYSVYNYKGMRKAYKRVFKQSFKADPSKVISYTLFKFNKENCTAIYTCDDLDPYSTEYLVADGLDLFEEDGIYLASFHHFCLEDPDPYILMPQIIKESKEFLRTLGTK